MNRFNLAVKDITAGNADVQEIGDVPDAGPWTR
jgi:hypothetical protein